VEIDGILEGIREAGRQKVRSLERDAQRQIEQVKAQAHDETAEQERRILADGNARLEREQALIEQQAAVAALQIHADARQALINETLEKTRGELSHIRSEADYPAILALWVDEALQALTPSLLPGQQVLLHFDPADRRAAEPLIKALFPMPRIAFDLSCAGGCRAESEDGLVTVDNTVESRLQRAGAALQRRLSVFFETDSTGG
jgi:vacuolar-type H+-ATPase subunit E/Vma4